MRIFRQLGRLAGSTITHVSYRILLAVPSNNHVRYFATFCITTGTYVPIGVIIAWCACASPRAEARSSRTDWLLSCAQSRLRNQEGGGDAAVYGDRTMRKRAGVASVPRNGGSAIPVSGLSLISVARTLTYVRRRQQRIRRDLRAGLPGRYGRRRPHGASWPRVNLMFVVEEALTVHPLQVSYRVENQRRDRRYGKPVYNASVDTSVLADKVRQDIADNGIQASVSRTDCIRSLTSPCRLPTSVIRRDAEVGV